MTPELSEISLSELLQDRPPGSVAKVKDVVRYVGGVGFAIAAPDDLLMHCEAPHCNGDRFFDLSKDESDLWISRSIPSYPRIVYHCANCSDTRRVFIVEVDDVGTNDALITKVGQRPGYGSPIPSKLMSLVGSERTNFLKGRRCENQNLGVGAFSYYRRVVEAQRGRIFEAIIAAAQKLDMAPEDLKTLRVAAAENQFSKSLDMAKDIMPPKLLIQGHSPLKLLHNALSHGVHNLGDEECLAYAHSIRVVLGRLAESLDQVMKDEAEVESALKTLLSVRR